MDSDNINNTSSNTSNSSNSNNNNNNNFNNGKKLYVGNLPFSTTEEALKTAFSKIGTVLSVKVITDHISGRSKGFAFVEMTSENEAQSAIEKLNGTEFEGRPIRVTIALPPSGGRNDRGHRGMSGDRNKSRMGGDRGSNNNSGRTSNGRNGDSHNRRGQ